MNDYNLLRHYYPIKKIGKTDDLIIYAAETKMQAIVAQENTEHAGVG